MHRKRDEHVFLASTVYVEAIRSGKAISESVAYLGMRHRAFQAVPVPASHYGYLASIPHASAPEALRAPFAGRNGRRNGQGAGDTLLLAA